MVRFSNPLWFADAVAVCADAVAGQKTKATAGICQFLCWSIDQGNGMVSAIEILPAAAGSSAPAANCNLPMDLRKRIYPVYGTTITFMDMKRTLITLLSTAALALAAVQATAQDYFIDKVFLGTRTKFELQLIFGQPVDYAVNLYRIRYATLGTDNLPDTASALIVTPEAPADQAFPIVVYGHGTTTGPTDVPSQLRGGYEVAMGYASKGFISVAPDYLGLGTSHGFHPYVHAATEASASRDAFFAALEYLENNPIEWNPEFLFIAGYSQGGHTGAALHKELETNWPFIPVTAATHMSGPYSLSGVMRDQVLSDDPYGYPAYIAYIVLGYQEVYDNLYTDIHGIFKEPYVTEIIKFYDGTINLQALNNQLITLLTNQTGSTVAKEMLQDSVVDNMVNDSDYILNVVLRENDLDNWAPLAPTRLYYCGGDTQVPHENALVAEASMQALGATDVQAVQINASFDHGPCVLPSVTSSINFFQSFLETSIPEIPKNIRMLAITPNPADDIVALDWDDATGDLHYVIVNLQGQSIAEGQSQSKLIDVSTLATGIYTLIINTANETRLARLIRS